jgi:hypothetical protein
MGAHFRWWHGGGWVGGGVVNDWRVLWWFRCAVFEQETPSDEGLAGLSPELVFCRTYRMDECGPFLWAMPRVECSEIIVGWAVVLERTRVSCGEWVGDLLELYVMRLWGGDMRRCCFAVGGHMV